MDLDSRVHRGVSGTALSESLHPKARWTASSGMPLLAARFLFFLVFPGFSVLLQDLFQPLVTT